MSSSDGQEKVIGENTLRDVRMLELELAAARAVVRISTLKGNRSGPAQGGGIRNDGTLTVVDSTLSDNFAPFFGGGIYSSGTLTMTNSTVSGNSAGTGGGILINRGTLTVANSTLSGNSAGTGGGIANLSGDTILRNSLVSGNSATEAGAEIARNADATMTAENNILGDGSLTDADAFDNFDPDASNLVATSDKENIPLGSILETTLSDNGGLHRRWCSYLVARPLTLSSRQSVPRRRSTGSTSVGSRGTWTATMDLVPMSVTQARSNSTRQTSTCRWLSGRRGRRWRQVGAKGWGVKGYRSGAEGEGCHAETAVGARAEESNETHYSVGHQYVRYPIKLTTSRLRRRTIQAF